jgi:hypothetical protein
VATESREGRLAKTLRSWREQTWPDVDLTQAQLAMAFSTENRVGSATISTWESPTSLKTPNADRLHAYARFFATRRSLDGGPHLIPEEELTESEHQEFRRLEHELVGLSGGEIAAEPRLGSFTFAEGPVTIICPVAPKEHQGTLARTDDPDFTKLLQYADLDALIEIHGHVRAANPTLDVFHRIATEAKADDISTHVILLGGIAWNRATRRFQEAIRQVPIAQVASPEQKSDPFTVEVGGSTQVFESQWEGEGTERELAEDVAFLARLPNPFNQSRSMTICNGVHSRGVLGAVRCLTDARVRTANENYLAERFPDGRFALLLRVPVVSNETLSPDLQNPHTRLYEWPPEESADA